MFLDEKEHGEPSIGHFTMWAAARPKKEAYDWGNTWGRCIIKQYSDHLGRANANWRTDNPALYRRLYSAASGYPRTMEGVLKRL